MGIHLSFIFRAYDPNFEVLKTCIFHGFWGPKVLIGYFFRGLLLGSLTASLPLKNDAWKTILSFWDSNLSGENSLLNFGGVHSFKHIYSSKKDLLMYLDP